VVRILHPKRRQAPRAPPPPPPISRRDVAPQRRQRPALPPNVMQHPQHPIPAPPPPQQIPPPRPLPPPPQPPPPPPPPPHPHPTHRPAPATPANPKPHPPRRPRKDLLPRHSLRLWEHRAQALVTLDNVTQRSLQRRNIQRSRQPHRHRDRVGRARSLKTVQEPQPTLRIRQRDLRRPRTRPQRRSRR